MPNSIGPTGLVTQTRQELIDQFTIDMQAIYGPDINLEPDTPDGQMMNIFIQAVLDNLDLLTQIYNMFDPDSAIGAVLDQRVAINGIQRQAGTFTVTDVTIVTDRALNLFGLDQALESIYTVADNAGSEWQLLQTQNISGPGTYVFQFQSAVAGAVLTVPNTITTPVSIVLGVTSINNPTPLLTLGINEESDANLKIRRQKSVQLASQGYLAGLLAALENINGVGSAFVYENTTGLTDVDGVPGHSIWVVVSGTGDPAEIANAIYTKRNAGCGMFGAESFVIVQVDNTNFTVLWDNVISETLYIKFNTTSLDGVNAPNIAGIRDQLPDILVPGVFEQLNVNDLATLVQQIDNNCLVTAAGFGLTAIGPFFNFLAPSGKNRQFTIDSANIIILPMILSPPLATIVVLGTQQFTGLGGFGALIYTMDANPSGGSISVSGLYTAGAVPATDIARVTDSQGNFATATITVVP